MIDRDVHRFIVLCITLGEETAIGVDYHGALLKHVLVFTIESLNGRKPHEEVSSDAVSQENDLLPSAQQAIVQLDAIAGGVDCDFLVSDPLLLNPYLLLLTWRVVPCMVLLEWHKEQVVNSLQNSNQEEAAQHKAEEGHNKHHSR